MKSSSLDSFVHLNIRSHYSILEAIGSIDDIIARTLELGFDTIALTDINNMFGAIEFYEKAKKAKIKPIIGLTLSVTGLDNQIYTLTLLAKTYTGYTNLIELSSLVRLNETKAVSFEELRQYASDIICLTGNYSSELAQYLLHSPTKVPELIKTYQDIFADNLYLELIPLTQTPDQVKANTLLLEISAQYNIPPVLTAQSMYLQPEQKQAHDIMLAIKYKTNIQNRNRLSFAHEDYSIKSLQTMGELSKKLNIPEEALINTQKIADLCDVEIPLYQIQLPAFDVPPLSDGTILSNEDYLRHLCRERIHYRYPKTIPDNLEERLEYEFEFIQKS